MSLDNRVSIVIEPRERQGRMQGAHASFFLRNSPLRICSHSPVVSRLFAAGREGPRRAAEGLRKAGGIETITPYTCSGLMVREYYIRV